MIPFEGQVFRVPAEDGIIPQFEIIITVISGDGYEVLFIRVIKNLGGHIMEIRLAVLQFHILDLSYQPVTVGYPAANHIGYFIPFRWDLPGPVGLIPVRYPRKMHGCSGFRF